MGAQSTAGDADRRRGLVRGARMRRGVLSALLVLGFGLGAVPAVAAGGPVFHPARPGHRSGRPAPPTSSSSARTAVRCSSGMKTASRCMPSGAVA